MKTAAALLAVLLAVPAAAQPRKTAKELGETPDLVIALKVSGPGGALYTSPRVQAQSQVSSTVKKDGKVLTFSAVPVVNPNNGRIRMEFKILAAWKGDQADLQSAVEIELGKQAKIYDSEGVEMWLVANLAD